MPDSEDRPPAVGGSGDERAIRSTLRLVEDLVEGLLGQVRRAERQGQAASGLPRGSKKALHELAGEAPQIEQHGAELLNALDVDRKPAQAPTPEPSSDAPSAGDRTSSDHVASSSEIVRSLAIDLRLQGHPRDEVLRRLEQTFGADEAAAVVDEVFEG
jgi:hypothetical protein